MIDELLDKEDMTLDDLMPMLDEDWEDDEDTVYWTVTVHYPNGEKLQSQYESLQEALEARKMLSEDPEFEECLLTIDEWD